MKTLSFHFRISLLFSFAVFLTSSLALSAQQNMYYVTKAKVKFISDAPLELIQAESTEITGILDISNGSFAFSIPMSSFQGFNSPLQRVHFNENYVESQTYPKSKFNGKIIEDIDYAAVGSTEIRAKGKLNIHGKDQVHTIKCKLKNQTGKITVISEFVVKLADFDIKIPSIVGQKISESITVSVELEMQPKK